jgi:lipoyl(octanoyl) transferase
MRTLHTYRLGRTPYSSAHALQERLVEARKEERIGDTLLLLEHPKVITLGRAAKLQHLLRSQSQLADEGYDFHETGRGGDVTFHGPGQLVGYPIVDLKPDRQDVRRYVSDLEETMIRICADYGLSAGRVAGRNGCWIGERKVGAVGVRISRWITMHGFALNVSTDLTQFGAIVPCGIADAGVTSLTQELGREVPMAEVELAAARHLAQLLDAEVRFVDGEPRWDE